MVDLFWLWRSENDGKCSFLNLCCIYTDRRTFRTVEQIWKEPRFRQKNAAAACFKEVSNAAEGVSGRCGPTRLCNTNFLADLQWVRPHLEWRGDAWKLFTCTCSSGGWIWKGFPTGKLVPSPSQLSSQMHHFLRHMFMLFISYTYLFCVKTSNTKNFLLHKP